MSYKVKSGKMNLESVQCPKQVGVAGRPVLRVALDNDESFDVPALAQDGSIATVNGVPVLERKEDGGQVFHDWKPDWVKDAGLAGKVLADLAGAPKAPAAPAAPAKPS